MVGIVGIGINPRRVYLFTSQSLTLLGRYYDLRLIDVIPPLNWKKINRTLVADKYNFSFQAFRNYIFDDLARH